MMFVPFDKNIIFYGLDQLKKKTTRKYFGLDSVFQKRMLYVYTNLTRPQYLEKKICNGLFFIMIKICCDESLVFT